MVEKSCEVEYVLIYEGFGSEHALSVESDYEAVELCVNFFAHSVVHDGVRLVKRVLERTPEWFDEGVGKVRPVRVVARSEVLFEQAATRVSTPEI